VKFHAKKESNEKGKNKKACQKKSKSETRL
jgi:hypothetical protein